MHAIKKGLLWQQRDRIFSRWKERYFILTRDYLHCFKRASGSGPDRISDMGQFIFKVKLVEVDRVEWINKKTYSTVVLDLGRDGRVLLRAPEGLEDWFELLEECTLASKERRKALRISRDPSQLQQNGDPRDSISSSLDEWLLARHKIAGLQNLADSVPDLNHDGDSRRSSRDCDRDSSHEESQWLRRRPANHEQRLSLLTDIDINSYDVQMDTPPPSVPPSFRGRPTSYRLNSDVFFMSAAPNDDRERHRYGGGGGTATPSFCSTRPVLTPVGSFRSTHLFNPSKMAADRYSVMSDAPQVSRYRDRSQSETHKQERHNWKATTEATRRTSYLVNATQV
ncbi:uncharacterized protein LOC134546316 isoform X2 [Bacillus rossius redtenbacheri]